MVLLLLLLMLGLSWEVSVGIDAFALDPHLPLLSGLALAQVVHVVVGMHVVGMRCALRGDISVVHRCLAADVRECLGLSWSLSSLVVNCRWVGLRCLDRACRGSN